MPGEIRVAVVCIAILTAVAGTPQGSVQTRFVALDNEYVNVEVEPPRAIPPTVIADAVSLTGHPFVRVYVPIHPIAPSHESPRGTSLDSIFAIFREPHGMYGASGTQKGTFYHIDLKSFPDKTGFRDDAISIDGAHNELLLNNERVRVVRIHFEPGEAGPMVDKRLRVIVAVTDSQAAVTFPDGHSEPREMKAGTVSFGNAGRQATKNTGTTPLENIVVELKSK
jgi:hypothetical protein